MHVPAQFNRHLPWLNLSAGVLIALLQRTPAVRTFVRATDYVVTSRAGEILRAAFTAAALGAIHGRAGATTFQVSRANPVRGRVGEPLELAFTYIGTPSNPASFQVSGTLPPGLRYVPAPIAGTIRSGTPAITGTPTQAGSFTIRVQGFNAEGLTNNVQQSIVFEIEGVAAVAPTITTPPQSQTVDAGANVTFSVQATGTPPPTYQWTRDGSPIVGATSSSLSLPNVQASDAGSYAVMVSVAGAGSVTSSAATLTVNVPGGGGEGPAIALHPIGVTAAVGSTASFSVVAAGTSNTFQWRRNGSALAGATDATLLLRNITAANAGDYTAMVSSGGRSSISEPATLTVASGASRLANLSVRSSLAAMQRLIVGFATNGAKAVLLRGVGPTLGSFGVSGAYANPRLELYNSVPDLISQNEDWGGVPALATAFGAVGAFPLANTSQDAALQSFVTGSQSAHVTGPSTGVVLVEVYDSGSAMNPRLVNVSARNIVGTGDNILIAGFVIDGTVGKTLLIRAVGPTLESFGVGGTLVDPKLEIYNSSTTKIAENDNWVAAVGTTFQGVGAFGLTANSRDAALLVTLMPGAYSAQVSGVNAGTGEALVEVYEVP